ncbi:hypothetical protein [Dactylosporangium sp. CA-139066]|uniref:hypothetical protein n=1 Tax=Dactylosporangium sp. CA-139066 TaxID=3239930 RepID=UPI003D8D7EEB
MTAPEELLRRRLVQALRSCGPNAATGALADAVLALGDLESRWEVRGGDPDDPGDRWYSYCDTRAEADALAAKRKAEVFAVFSLRFMPISVDQEGPR